MRLTIARRCDRLAVGEPQRDVQAQAKAVKALPQKLIFDNICYTNHGSGGTPQEAALQRAVFCCLKLGD